MGMLWSAVAARCVILFGLILSMLILPPFGAAQAASPDEARLLVLKAADLLAREGKDKAYAVFQDRAGPFWKNDLYVFVINFQGAWEAYPPKPDVVGQSLLDLKDVDGKCFVKDMVDLAQSQGEGWVDYKWKNPQTNRIQPKTSYIKRVGDVFVAAGVYE